MIIKAFQRQHLCMEREMPRIIYKYFSKVMNLNRTYFEWYGFDVNVVRILIATCTYKSTL